DAADGAAGLRGALRPAAARRGRAVPVAGAGGAGGVDRVGPPLGGDPGGRIGGRAAERAGRVADGDPGGVRDRGGGQPLPGAAVPAGGRSEERRVGKECRAGWAARDWTADEW